MQTSVGIDPAVARAAQDFWQQLDSPIALSCAILARYGEWIQIAEKRVDPGHYVALLPRLPLPGASRLARDYQSVELLRKFPGLPIGVDRAQKALDSFFKNEATCKRTNERLRHLSYCIETGFVPDPADEYLHTFVERARKFIRRVLGPLPRFLVPRFGPGSTFESKASPASHNLTLGDKMECGFVCTGPCVPLLPFAYESAWGRWVAQRTSQSSHTLVRGNRFTTVPKDALKDRGICIEAGVNVAFQCYLGALMKGRLWDAGCDLYAGQAYHGRVAREASMSGSSATIDLSDASDTVCLWLVRLLLPEQWVDLLEALRSPCTLVDGKWVRLEKFSSMGNGFTFELETLIFWAISVAAGCEPWEASVYGDDIIVPSDKASDVLAALRYFGFSPNQRKTFVSGHFRESCGTDSFAGVDITTFRWKDIPTGPSDWFSVHNGFRRVLGNCKAVWNVLTNVPTRLRVFGPEGLGDVVLWDARVEKWTIRIEHSIRYVRCLLPDAKSIGYEHFPPGVQMALALYGTGTDLTPRGDPRGYRLDFLPYS